MKEILKTRIGIIAIVLILGIGGIGYFLITEGEDVPEPRCGNGICEPEYGETWETCPEDCDEPEEDHCGDGICEPEKGENCMTCPEDCGECPPEPEDIGFRFPYAPVSTGDTFWVTVYLDPTASSRSVGCWVVDVDLPNNVIVNEVVVGNQNVWSFFDPGTIESDQVLDVQGWTTGSESDKTDLFRMQCEAISSGTAIFSFSQAKIGDENAQEFAVTENEGSLQIQ